MKKSFICIALLFATAIGFAQSEKFQKAMAPLVAASDSTRDRDALISLANSFERIGNVEKEQWLPLYYASITTINAAFALAMDGKMNDKSSDIDPMADKAEMYLDKADSLSPDNSEIWVAKKMLATLRMMADPMNRYMQYGPIAEKALNKAKTLNAENPRVYILEGQDLYFTPEQFGGDKVEAKARFETALAKFETQTPESELHPKWGLGQTKYFLSLMK